MLKIGPVQLANGVVVAPMASVTNLAFRSLLHQFKPGLIFNEMVSDEAICYRNEKTLSMLKVVEQDHPIAFQLFGVNPLTMVSAAKYLDKETDCDIIDINMGCPVNKVVKQGKGSALMQNIHQAADLAYQVVQAVDKPVTVKMRLGWNQDSIVCVDLARLLEAAGVKALSVHGRTRMQFYQGRADWSWIKAVKEAVSIPVFGNGDIQSREDGLKKQAESHVDGLMIGRALMHRPWLIRELWDPSFDFDQSPESRCDLLKAHARALIDLMGEKNAIRQMRSHSVAAIKGLPQSRQIKHSLVTMTTWQEFVILLDEYLADLKINRGEINEPGNEL